MPRDPYKELAGLIEQRAAGHAGRVASTLPAELGTITQTLALKLDRFRHEIKDYLVADWELQIELPQASRVIQTAAPVETDGSDIPDVTTYSSLTRLDFKVTGEPTTTVKVHLNLKAGLRAGDRVLVLPVNGGQDFVVIAKVIPNA
ncbi:MAG: DUF2577 family protein [Deltaproteobacteria bacterium]|nr:DUF2577 family protein [Deltaproteobacteria bacterium]